METSSAEGDTEIPSPVSGILFEITASEDSSVMEGDTLAVIGRRWPLPRTWSTSSRWCRSHRGRPEYRGATTSCCRIPTGSSQAVPPVDSCHGLQRERPTRSRTPCCSCGTSSSTLRTNRDRHDESRTGPRRGHLRHTRLVRHASHWPSSRQRPAHAPTGR
ncbi:hypothetical protein OIE50_01115 [Streptomyces canus]|uniref:hypothetical protein n=1 Tax=Streptomyces canus TaxID=58343 RepID=UPI003256126F